VQKKIFTSKEASHKIFLKSLSLKKLFLLIFIAINTLCFSWALNFDLNPSTGSGFQVRTDLRAMLPQADLPPAIVKAEKRYAELSAAQFLVLYGVKNETQLKHATNEIEHRIESSKLLEKSFSQDFTL
jgi:hypothetical protein